MPCAHFRERLLLLPLWSLDAEPLLHRLHCEATLGWLQGVVGVILPTLVAGCTAPPATGLRGPGPAEGHQMGTEPEEDIGSRCSTLRFSAARSMDSKAQHVAALASCTLWRMNAALRDSCQRAGRSLPMAVALGAACCLIAGNVYALARGVAASQALAAARAQAL